MLKRRVAAVVIFSALACAIIVQGQDQNVAQTTQPGPLTIERVSDRSAFFRMEPSQVMRIAVKNAQATPCRGARLRLSMEKSGEKEKEFALPELAPGATYEAAWDVDTRLRPDRYVLDPKLTVPGNPPTVVEERFSVTIAPRPLPHVMPVFMWGTPSTDRERLMLKDIGFTHYLITMGDHARIWKVGGPCEAASPDTLKRHRERLDTAVAEGMYVYGYLYPGRWARSLTEYQRVGRDGKPYNEPVAKKRDICGLLPEMQRLCRDEGISIAHSYGQFPSLQGFDIHSETRDDAKPCFHPADREAFRKHAGFDIPAEAGPKAGIHYSKRANFPPDRVIPDDYPLYMYYKWYWTEGDGWVRLSDAVNDGLKSTGRTDWLTYYGPATRVPSLFGGGGKLDAVINWTYVYPDPIGIGLNVDELFAMAKGAPRPQAVMMGIQIICYRSVIAPPAAQPERKAGSAWEDADPEAAYITVPPMCLREGFWAEMARPLPGLVHHGYESLFPADKQSAYRYTNPETMPELKRLIHEVVRPLGPTLLQVPDAPADVAFLESFASQMFAGRGTYGWGRGWEGAAYLALQYAQLQPEVFYEETIQRRGLDGIRLLVMPNCDVLPKSVAEAVRAFQARGGLVVSDERLCPGIKADIVVQAFDRTGSSKQKAQEDKATILGIAANLRQQLDARYSRTFESSNPEVITRRRRCGDADYLFVVNDLRKYGDYVGRYGMTMEDGLPSDATLTLRRDGGVVYDLIARRQVAVEAADGRIRFPVHLGPCEGRVFLVLPRPIAKIAVQGPERIARGQSGEVAITVLDSDGRPPRAVIPLSVEIRDPDGRSAEFSGYYGAQDGVVRIPLDMAANDAQGLWQVRAQELASGQAAAQYIRVDD